MLETLFDIRTMVSEALAVVMAIAEDDVGEQEEEEDSRGARSGARLP
jgi:hypothetical protein